MKKLGIALLGVGPGSEPHLQSLATLADSVDLRWTLARSNPDKARAAVPPSTRVTGALQEILGDPLVEAVIVATPAYTHLEIASAALAAGKHTLVEKPLDVTLARAEELVGQAASHGVQLGVVLQHRFRPGAQRLKQLLDAGTLGAVQSAVLQVPWWRSQEGYYAKAGRGTLARDGGGVLLTQAIHAIDLFRSLVGVRAVVASQIATTAIHEMETEDFASALLTLGNGAPGVLVATTAMYPGRAEVLELVCRHATATLEGGNLRVQYHDGRVETLDGESKSGSGDSIMDFSPDAHIALHRDFFGAVAEGRAPTVTGAEAVATHRLIDQIVRQGQAA
ncbi:putative dehydrogenase [Acidovorax sp. CF316]|uniref:Gfo/Idh/MocA family protein n=1 Tax=Acidovorax sp. CF316 TaxID=1144317 RepID=UPI00026BEC04|nr:Gfo/Idh/MocA family oxidoreductase [Acidovorax sp. CF316]EJE50934.1 putative dehydrogenase [Acidovorax sp. CF316]